MAALTKNRNTPARAGMRRGYLIAASVHALTGGLAVLSATGFAQPGTTATNVVALGVFAEEFDNSAGANGAATVEVERGIFRFDNSAGADEIAITDVGKKCFIVDDQTVALTDGTATRSVAGIIDHVDDDGVWVLVDPTSGAAI